MTDLVYDIRSAEYQVIILNVSVIIKRYGVSRLTGQSHIFLYSDILLCQINWSYNPIPSLSFSKLAEKLLYGDAEERIPSTGCGSI